MSIGSFELLVVETLSEIYIILEKKKKKTKETQTRHTETQKKTKNKKQTTKPKQMKNQILKLPSDLRS